jgi:hypothetical protein
MSRSYKKHPIYKDNTGSDNKTDFNRRLRRTRTDVPNGSHYKKENESWDICDWVATTPSNLDELEWNEKKIYIKK